MRNISESIDIAKQKVAQALGIPEDKVDADPSKDKEAMTATQKVVAVAKVLQAASNEDEDLSEVIEKIAKKVDGDSNLTKAVESVSNAKTAKTAMATAEAVENAIDQLIKQFFLKSVKLKAKEKF